jgi:glycosyltransferase involved in cell wall biosynthesis
MNKMNLLLTQLSELSANPLVSIVITNYNYGAFLAEAIDSVFNQTYRNFELIVVDDGSTDNSKEVIESYGSRLIPILQNNCGFVEAANVGIKHCKGEIICFLDADDYFHLEKLENVVKAFMENPNYVQIVHCKTIVNREGLTIGSGPNRFSQGDVRKLLLKWGQYVWETTSALSYRREALEQVLPIPPNAVGVDCYFSMTIPFVGQVGSINKSLVFYRQHGNNMGSRNPNRNHWMNIYETMAISINKVAAQAGINDHFDIQNNADYISFKSLQQGGLPLKQIFQTIWLALQESVEINRSFKESFNKLLQCCIFLLFPKEGQAYIRFGRRGYLRYKLTGKEPQAFKLSGS